LDLLTYFKIKIHHLSILLILIIPLRDGILWVESWLLLASMEHPLRMYTFFRRKVWISWSQEDGIVWSSFGKLMEINCNKLENFGPQNPFNIWVDNSLYWLQHIVKNGFIFGIWKKLPINNSILFIYLKVP
jgi:hypothetical protein